VWKLLRLRWTIWISGFRRAKTARRIGMILLALLALAGLGFIFFLSWLLLGFLRSPDLAEFVGDTRPLLTSVPVLIVSAAFLGILLTSFGVLLQALYLAGDMEFLLSTPVPIRAVFVSKLLQAVLPNFSLILLFGLPVLFGLGASQGYSLLYYPLVLILMAALALAAAGLSSLLVMLVVRVFPARRVAEVLGLVVGVGSFLCSQSGQFANWVDVSRQQAVASLQLVTRVNSPWSPLSWAGRGLVEIGEGRWLPGVLLVLLTLALAGGIFAISLTTAERLYYTGWSNVQTAPRKKKAVRAPRRAEAALPVSELARRVVPAPVRGIMVKDFLVLRRDLRNLSQLITPLILGVVYGAMLLRSGGPPAGRGEAPEWFMQVLGNARVYGNVGISLFVGWSLLSRLAMMGFSHEGKSYWLLKTAPVSARKLLLAKFLVAYLPVLILGWGFLLAISLLQRADVLTILYSLAVVALTVAGTTGLNLAFGVAGANLEWSDPRHMQRGASGCLGALVTMAYLVFSLTLFFGPLVLAELLAWPAVVGQVAGLLAGGVTSLACAIAPLWIVAGRVARLGE
jgi:ABC-2 type transport system permease protein